MQVKKKKREREREKIQSKPCNNFLPIGEDFIISDINTVLILIKDI
jgi:hypothetical protein